MPKVSINQSAPGVSGWALNGNTVGSEKYIGTNDNFDFPVYTHGIRAVTFDKNQNTGFGIAAPLARGHFKGSGSSPATFTAKFEDSSGNILMNLRDDGIIFFNNTNSYWSPGFIQLYGAGASSSTLLSLINNSGSASIFQLQQAGNSALMTMKDSANATAIIFNTVGDSYFNGGNLAIGAITANANAILDVQSTTKAFMPPRMTTTQKNAISAPTAGMLVYDSTLNKLAVYTTAWEIVTSL